MIIRPVKAALLGDQVADQLRLLMVSGELKPGTHLGEENMAGQFGVSRGPIRDALKTLEAEGLVESRNKGVFVVGLDDSDITDLYELRKFLENAALAHCVENPDEVDWGDFERAITDMASAATQTDAAAFATADLAFHAELFRGSQKRRLAAVWHSLLPTLRALLQTTVSHERDLGVSLESHRTLFESMRSGKLEAARELLHTHLDNALTMVRTARSE